MDRFALRRMSTSFRRLTPRTSGASVTCSRASTHDSRAIPIARSTPRNGRHWTNGRNLTLETALGGLDIVQRLAGVPSYGELADDAVEMELFGLPVLVCSRRHLRAMKRARGSHRDLADLEDLDATDD